LMTTANPPADSAAAGCAGRTVSTINKSRARTNAAGRSRVGDGPMCTQSSKVPYNIEITGFVAPLGC
jgi:hypothetical protein